jgi:hypothetical protein
MIGLGYSKSRRAHSRAAVSVIPSYLKKRKKTSRKNPKEVNGEW